MHVAHVDALKVLSILILRYFIEDWEDFIKTTAFIDLACFD